MNRDFAEMLSALSAAGAEYLVVGAHALAAHGRPRATGDLDIWVRPSVANAERVWAALSRFGAPLSALKKEDLHAPGIVFQIGIEPVRIDILTAIDGVEFESAWQRRLVIQIEDQSVPLLGRDDLIRNKRAAGRPQDLADVASLEQD
jgi:hypothetical protein